MRFDFRPAEAVARGETFDFEFTVYEQGTSGAYVPASSFASYSTFRFELYDDVLELPTLAVNSATNPAYFDTSAPPVVRVKIPYSLTVGLLPGTKVYELWADVGPDKKRLAFGYLPVTA
jgi:hypothetical protein